jgi:PAS domain S-box-containing protein
MRTIRSMTGNLDTLLSLKKEEERFRLLIEHALDIVTILDSRGIVQYESPSLERHFGWKPAELVGKNAFDFIHPKDVKAVQAKFARLLSAPQGSISAEFRF